MSRIASEQASGHDLEPGRGALRPVFSLRADMFNQDIGPFGPDAWFDSARPISRVFRDGTACVNNLLHDGFSRRNDIEVLENPEE